MGFLVSEQARASESGHRRSRPVMRIVDGDRGTRIRRAPSIWISPDLVRDRQKVTAAHLSYGFSWEKLKYSRALGTPLGDPLGWLPGERKRERWVTYGHGSTGWGKLGLLLYFVISLGLGFWNCFFGGRIWNKHWMKP